MSKTRCFLPKSQVLATLDNAVLYTSPCKYPWLVCFVHLPPCFLFLGSLDVRKCFDMPYFVGFHSCFPFSFSVPILQQISTPLIGEFFCFRLQGEQTLFTYCSRGSFSWICMAPSVGFCCYWAFYCCIQFWSFHHSSLLPGPVSWNHIFSASIQNEEIPYCGISHHCNSVSCIPSFSYAILYFFKVPGIVYMPLLYMNYGTKPSLERGRVESPFRFFVHKNCLRALCFTLPVIFTGP